MTTTQTSIESFARGVAALASAATPSEVFKALLEASRNAGPRAAVYLVRQGRIRGWGAVGYPAPAVATLRRHDAPVADGWLGRLAASGSAVDPSGAGAPALGLPRPAACAGEALSVGGRAIALVVIERGAAEGPWAPELLAVFARVAQLRLELDLARRRIAAGATPESSVAPPPDATPIPAISELALHVPAAGGAPVETLHGSLAPGITSDATVDPQFDRARRYARLVATDIRLYNEDAVASGRRQGDLVSRLGDQIGRGREAFLKRHGDLGPTALDVFHEACVEVLAGGDASLLPRPSIE